MDFGTCCMLKLFKVLCNVCVKFDSGAEFHGKNKYFFVLLHYLSKYTVMECFLKGNDYNLQAFGNGAEFYSKQEYFEESLEL